MRRIFQDKRANIAMTFALGMVPIVVLGGSASDLSFVFAERQRAQDALDRATLAGGKNLGLVTSSAIIADVTKLYADFYQPPPGSTTVLKSVTVDAAKGTVTAQADISTETSFLPLIDIKSMTSALNSKVAIGNSDFDVVMVLDTSGSMAGSKISTLKTAATNLTTTLYNMNTIGTRTDRVQVGVVPFSTSVNVGSSYGPTYSGTTRTSSGTGSTWLDVNTKSPIHTQNWNTGLTDNRFDLFNYLKVAFPSYASSLSWGGCVEMRPYPYSVSDAAPDASNPSTLFVPMFAPDEAGYGTSSKSWTSANYNGTTANDYLSDKSGTSCSSTVDLSTTTGIAEAQGRTCKYKSPAYLNGTPSTTWGPNYGCQSKPITPMTFTKSTITTAINALSATGNTNILEGVAWGLRALSPGAPFTEGRTATAERPLQKIMIVMTDGDNTYSTNTSNTVNKSAYGPYGYLSKNRLNLSSISSSNVLAKQNSLTLEACTNAKSAGVVVYTVAFQVTNSTTKGMLTSCATSTDFSFSADSNSELLEVFETIANQISRLRIAS